MEHFTDQTLGSPVGHGELATFAANAQDLGGGALGIRKHGAEGAEYDVEGFVFEGNRLGIAFAKIDFQALRGGALAGSVEQGGDEIDAGDFRSPARGG